MNQRSLELSDKTFHQTIPKLGPSRVKLPLSFTTTPARDALPIIIRNLCIPTLLHSCYQVSPPVTVGYSWLAMVCHKTIPSQKKILCVQAPCQVYLDCFNLETHKQHCPNFHSPSIPPCLPRGPFPLADKGSSKIYCHIGKTRTGYSQVYWQHRHLLVKQQLCQEPAPDTSFLDTPCKSPATNHPSHL